MCKTCPNTAMYINQNMTTKINFLPKYCQVYRREKCKICPNTNTQVYRPKSRKKANFRGVSGAGPIQTQPFEKLKNKLLPKMDFIQLYLQQSSRYKRFFKIPYYKVITITHKIRVSKGNLRTIIRCEMKSKIVGKYTPLW